MEPKIKEDYLKSYTDPRSSQLGSTTDQLEINNIKNTIFIELRLELGCVTYMVSSAPANWFWKYL